MRHSDFENLDSLRTFRYDQIVKSSAFIDKFRSEGFRLTKARRALLELFEASKVPLSAAEIMRDLSTKGVVINKTTVYREFDFLVSQGAIREIDLLDGSKRYEKIVEDDHHHHLVCTKCRQIVCLELPEDFEKLEKHIQRKHKFKVTSHVLEFFGLCTSCQ